MNRLSHSYLEDVRREATRICVERALTVGRSMIDDGFVYGDVEVEGAELVAKIIDLEERGVLQFLAVIAPDLYERWMRRYDRLVAEKLIGA